MIRINLLPERELKKKEDIRKQLLAFIACVLFILAACIHYNSYLDRTVDSLESAKRDKEAELKRYEAIVKKVTEMEKKINLVKSRIDLINNISKYRSAVIRSLDQIVMSVPQNNVYIKALTHSKDVISLECTARNHDSIAEFMERLKAQTDISSVFLKNATLKNVPNMETELVDFSLVCDTVYKAPPEPPKKEKK